MRAGLMVSGQLGLNTLKAVSSYAEIAAVLTDKGSEGIIDLTEKKSIPLFVGNPRKGKAKEFIGNIQIDVLISVNYLFIIEKDLIDWPSLLAFNVHGSLLPKYRGRTPHVWAIINNESVCGVTAHCITEGCDEGDILFQKEVVIGHKDTGADILVKYEAIYPDIVKKVLIGLEKNELKRIPQDHSLATYFGKRTPEDGLIDWNWSKERIYNWVRAQANPYPGAFTFCKGQKMIIDHLEFDEFGFREEMKNGLVLTTSPLRVKTPNGAVRILSMREPCNVESGTILNS